MLGLSHFRRTTQTHGDYLAVLSQPRARLIEKAFCSASIFLWARRQRHARSRPKHSWHGEGQEIDDPSSFFTFDDANLSSCMNRLTATIKIVAHHDYGQKDRAIGVPQGLNQFAVFLIRFRAAIARLVQNHQSPICPACKQRPRRKAWASVSTNPRSSANQESVAAIQL